MRPCAPVNAARMPEYWEIQKSSVCWKTCGGFFALGVWRGRRAGFRFPAAKSLDAIHGRTSHRRGLHAVRLRQKPKTREFLVQRKFQVFSRTMRALVRALWDVPADEGEKHSRGKKGEAARRRSEIAANDANSRIWDRNRQKTGREDKNGTGRAQCGQLTLL